MDSLQTVLNLVFGVGGVGVIAVLVTSYRRLKTGKLNDEESIIKRLHRELGRAEEKAEALEQERNDAQDMTAYWREEASLYRLQLIEGGIEPREAKAMPSHE